MPASRNLAFSLADLLRDSNYKLTQFSAAGIKALEERVFIKAVREKDVLINGTGIGTIGRAAPYLEKAQALPDNHVTVLKIDESRIDPVYLSTFLNSAAGQLQVEKYFKGSSWQIELYPEDIANFQVWIAPTSIQSGIRSDFLASRAARQKSKALLEHAKRAVEIAIEQDEASALAYIEGK